MPRGPNLIRFQRATQSSGSQIQGEREIRIKGLRRSGITALRPAICEKAGETAGLSLVSVDGKSRITASAWMGHVISAAAETALVPRVIEIENERRMHADRWLQT